MTHQPTITLLLPPIEPGEEPPSKCPVCGSPTERERRSLGGFVQYACGARYKWYCSVGDEAKWAAFDAHGEWSFCPSPTTPAAVAALIKRGGKPSEILDAVLAGLTDEQRRNEYGFTRATVENSLNDIIHALKEAGA